jgi:hypothetical protein
MNPNPLPNAHRIGFHYYPDADHYRQADLETWLPRLVDLGSAWLTLLAPAERAIPEDFIRGLLSSGVQPLLHFCLPPGRPTPLETLRLLLGAYARWGVRRVAFFERPNARESWAASAWAQDALVERFLDGWIPLAQAAQEQGLTVITPPLEPGGDYWDLAFLRTALRALQRRNCSGLLENLALGAYAWFNGRPLDWGAGGPRRWPGARPYHTPAGQQDQLGFHIFDWYLSVCQDELGMRLPVYLLRAGQRLPGGLPPGQAQAARIQHARQNLQAARWVAGGPDAAPAEDACPPEIQACSFWLLAAEPGHPHAQEAWFLPSGERLPAAEAFRQWAAHLRQPQGASQPELPADLCQPGAAAASEAAQADGNDAAAGDPAGAPPTAADSAVGLQTTSPAAPIAHPIGHYVLLPLYAWGAANWDLALVETLMQDSHPAIGFSLAEARLARRVTVVGAEGAISGEALAMLRQSGCQVERLLEDGTLIAT